MTRHQAKQIALNVLTRWKLISASKIGRRNLMAAAVLVDFTADEPIVRTGGGAAIRALSRPIRL